MRGRKSNINLIGKTFYELTVIDEGPRKNNKPTWLCECSCGKNTLAHTYELQSGNKKSCGHLRGLSRKKDLSNKTFGDLFVLNESNHIGEKVAWLCVCSCGKECVVVANDLTSGKRKDCGHSHDAYMHETRTIDIVGNTYGYLKVLKMLPSLKRGKKWRAMCRCECLLCGNIIDVQKDYIISNDTKSCGCLKSKGEQEILDYLLMKNIPHERQYRFSDLKTEKNGFCYFDFAIFDNDKNLKCLIEFQGKQHYEKIDFGQYEREITDPLKRKYCENNNILLFEIRYDSNVKEELDKILASQSCAKL